MSELSPQVQAFVRDMLGAADDLALLFAHQPSDAVEAELAKARAKMRADFVRHFPVGIDWDALLDHFVEAVRRRKSEIEMQGAEHDRAH
jgi:hypothetical protein